MPARFRSWWQRATNHDSWWSARILTDEFVAAAVDGLLGACQAGRSVTPETRPRARCNTPLASWSAVKAFISSLMANYQDQREAAARAAQALRYELLRAEDFGARPDTPQQACLQAVREADVILLLMGAHYGAIQPSGVSATHEEWREAVRTQRPVLVFVESVADREPAQQAFVDEVQGWEGGRFRDSFRSPDELRDKVTRALADLSRPGQADGNEVHDRALAALPREERGSFGGEARLVLAVAGGPRQPRRETTPREFRRAGIEWPQSNCGPPYGDGWVSWIQEASRSCGP